MSRVGVPPFEGGPVGVLGVPPLPLIIIIPKVGLTKKNTYGCPSAGCTPARRCHLEVCPRGAPPVPSDTYSCPSAGCTPARRCHL